MGIYAHGIIITAWWRSGRTKAANGEAVLPIVVIGRIDVAGTAEVEVVGVGAVRDWGR